MTDLSPLEYAAASLIARQISSDGGDSLLAQLATARVTSREFTGYGFFTYFDVDRSQPKADVSGSPAGWAESLVGPQRYPLQFLLYVEDGFAKMIEAYSYLDGCGDLDLLTCDFTPPIDVTPTNSR
ncbi:hypothetical protein [Brevundimonas bacteroides]|uniref:hypothetical protein n=1 Tax=Brevundimonas bacteroides TaxID=74311 RepID=UPI000496E52A|nr:hypothetical protein [Brevundimonas bacteroides]